MDDVTIETADGFLMQTVCLQGLLFETADTHELDYRAHLRDAMLQAIGTPYFALYQHIVRRKAHVAVEGHFPDAFSRKLDQRWRSRIAAREMYVNELFLTLVRRPIRGRSGWLQGMRSLASRSLVGEAAEAAVNLRSIHAASEALIASLSAYSPRMLTVQQTVNGLMSEPAEFIGCLYNGEMRPIALPNGPLGDYVPFRRISFGQDAFELAPAGPSERKVGAILSIKDYPAQTLPGMFDELMRLPFEMTLSQSFAFLERNQVLGRINLALRRMRSADDEALSLRDELAQAKNDVAARKTSFGEHHASISIQADTFDAVDAGVAEITAQLADQGIVAVREDIALEPAFWAQFPGNFKYIARRAMVSTQNFAGLASLHNFPVGKPRGNHWGEAVTLLETTSAGPYFFNFHHNDLGNFTVIGPSGSGKTVILNFLLAQARKFAPRIVFFDKDRGAELFIRAIGGQYDRLQPGRASGLNPLQMDDTPANRLFLLEWFALLARGLDEPEAEIVKDAIDANFAQATPYRRLRHLVALFRGHSKPAAGDLEARMRPWWGEGERAWLFDNEQDLTDLSADTVGFDMTAVLDDSVARTPALAYFFHRVEQRLDGNPAIIVVDEGWKALDDQVFVRRIKDWEKTIRKRNAIIGFATQSAQDALESRIASAIIEQAATQIFMLNPKARAEDYVDGFGLTQHEYELIRTLPDNSHCFLIKHGQESVIGRLNLSQEKDLLTILSGRERTVRILDELLEANGDNPTEWMSKLLERA